MACVVMFSCAQQTNREGFLRDFFFIPCQYYELVLFERFLRMLLNFVSVYSRIVNPGKSRQQHCKWKSGMSVVRPAFNNYNNNVVEVHTKKKHASPSCKMPPLLFL
jgi:hypothetical protein